MDRTLAQKGYMVIAVAEGAGQEHVSTGEKEPVISTRRRAQTRCLAGRLLVWEREKLMPFLQNFSPAFGLSVT